MNTFLFYKIAVYFFNGILEDTLFFYAEILVFLLTSTSFILCVKFLKNARKFIITFNIATFLVYFTQALTTRDGNNFLLSYINFLIFILISLINILHSANLTIIMFKTSLVNATEIFMKMKLELIFYLLSIVFLLYFLINNFLHLNLEMISVSYILNALELVVVTTIFIAFVYFVTLKKPEKMKETYSLMEKKERKQIFIAPFVLSLVSLILLLGQEIIYN
ncbi:MAG: hypothetical protein LBT02_02350 [Rickettsiales bacterium]|nr:hypothetical protein [Rickettsiales bacterium]